VDEPASQTAVLTLAQGAHRVEADYLRTAGAPVLMRVEWDAGAGLAPLAAPYLLVTPASPDRWAVAQAAGVLATGLAALYAALLLSLAVRLVGLNWLPRAARLASVWARRRREGRPSAAPSAAVPPERPLLALVLLAGLAWAVFQAWPFGQSVWVFNA